MMRWSVSRFAIAARLIMAVLACSSLPAIAAETSGVVAATSPAAATGRDTRQPHPDPTLSAASVVRIQLQALQENDDLDRGIEITYRFASPANKRQTGPLDRFVDMLKRPPYMAMLNARRIRYGMIQQQDDRAWQEVTVTSPGGVETTFVFYLSRQKTPPCTDCWMTDAVSVKRSDNQLDTWG